MKNKTVKKIASIVAIVLVIGFFSSYIIYHLVSKSNSEIKTEFALKETVYKTIDAQCFAIRDEEFIRMMQLAHQFLLLTMEKELQEVTQFKLFLIHPRMQRII